MSSQRPHEAYMMMSACTRAACMGRGELERERNCRRRVLYVLYAVHGTWFDMSRTEALSPSCHTP